ncbi:rifin PIR protein, putative [Plasmodium reichenowi]|uniref:Rifin PIR protein, putative n=1 Tax=Plasmodium reichenowi TaxID=5854 RepID=A0A2P9D819_PLARE|nr:rifin PIR protein, putative [Plasmodium reichenowi]
MKVHYTNILLLYVVNLSILLISCHINIQKNHYINARHTPNTTKIITTRLLCECELYAPANYDNGPQMKSVKENFDRQTLQRFEEYDEHMIKNRQKCKGQCEKDIQKIILKDKIEKELTEKLDALQTDITTEDIPTCVCKKSIADKTEKFCLKCGYGLGSVSPSIGLIGAIAVNVWKTGALIAAKNAAIAEGAVAGKAAGEAAGIATTIEELYNNFFLTILGRKSVQEVITANNFWDPAFIYEAVKLESTNVCFITPQPQTHESFCFLQSLRNTPNFFEKYVEASVQKVVSKSSNAAAQATKDITEQVTTAAIESSKNAVEAACISYHTAIIASIVAIVVIVLIMVIIYLILRYRRKKKIKKKIQYIKLLKE